MTTRTQTIQEKVHILDFIKTFALKDFIKKTKKQHREWWKTFANYICVKGYASKVYKEL